jgi:aconitase A
MDQSVSFSTTSYDKNSYNKVIDTSFTQLGVKTIDEQIAVQPTTNEFFSMYNDMFYDIPELGATNSHEYLIKKSSEYIDFEANQKEITALQAEIAQLRTDLLDAQKQNIQLQTGTPL